MLQHKMISKFRKYFEMEMTYYDPLATPTFKPNT